MVISSCVKDICANIHISSNEPLQTHQQSIIDEKMNQKCIDNSGPRDASGPRPMNVEAIAERAGDFEYNARIPLRQWLRAADTLQKEVH